MIKMFDLEFTPVKKKCGDPVLAGAIIGGLGLLGSGVSSASASHNTSMMIGESKEENEKQRNWASQEATIANERNMQNWREQFGAQSEQALKMFDLYNDYNHPSKVVERLRQAGFNPAAYFQQGSGQGMSNYTNLSAPSSTPASSSVPSAGMMGFNVQPATLDFTAAFNGISDAYSKFMQGSKDSAVATNTRNMAFTQLKLLSSQLENQELANALDKLEVEFKDKNFPTRLEHATADLMSKLAEIGFIESSKNYLDEQAATQAFKTLREEIGVTMDKKKAAMMDVDLKYLEASYLVTLDAKRADAEQARAVASNQREQALTEDALRGYKDIIMDSEAYKSYVLRDSQIEAARKAIETSNVLSDADKEEGLRRLRRVEDENRANGSGAWRSFDSFSEWVLNKGQKVNIPFIFTRNTNSK